MKIKGIYGVVLVYETPNGAEQTRTFAFGSKLQAELALEWLEQYVNCLPGYLVREVFITRIDMMQTLEDAIWHCKTLSGRNVDQVTEDNFKDLDDAVVEHLQRLEVEYENKNPENIVEVLSLECSRYTVQHDGSELEIAKDVREAFGYKVTDEDKYLDNFNYLADYEYE